jgi:hypothetical protein
VLPRSFRNKKSIAAIPTYHLAHMTSETVRTVSYEQPKSFMKTVQIVLLSPKVPNLLDLITRVRICTKKAGKSE